jgi:hypothetical protein
LDPYGPPRNGLDFAASELRSARGRMLQELVQVTGVV